MGHYVDEEELDGQLDFSALNNSFYDDGSQDDSIVVAADPARELAQYLYKAVNVDGEGSVVEAIGKAFSS
jgi:hypothetical protein